MSIYHPRHWRFKFTCLSNDIPMSKCLDIITRRGEYSPAKPCYLRPVAVPPWPQRPFVLFCPSQTSQGSAKERCSIFIHTHIPLSYLTNHSKQHQSSNLLSRNSFLPSRFQEQHDKYQVGQIIMEWANTLTTYNRHLAIPSLLHATFVNPSPSPLQHNSTTPLIQISPTNQHLKHLLASKLKQALPPSL